MIIYVCSPYGGKQENYEKARVAMRWVASQGHTPIAPHVMLHGILDDNNEDQRMAGMDLGVSMLSLADETWVFDNAGKTLLTPGMRLEIGYSPSPVRMMDISWEQLLLWDEENES